MIGLLLLLSSSFVMALDTSNLVSIWEMEESSGQLIDSHSSHDTITNNGNPTYQTSWLLNYGLDFDGTDDWFKTADHNDFDVGTGDFSACIWLNPDVDSTTLRPFGKDSYSGGSYIGWFMQKRNTDIIEFATRNSVDGDSTYCQGSISITSGNDYFVCGIRESNVLKIFVNGISDINCSESSNTNINNSVGIKIGAMDESPGTSEWIVTGKQNNHYLK